MPASRSRTDRWRDCLRQVYERGGGLEITIPTSAAEGSVPAAEQAHGANLIWRVRILGLTDREILIEPPSAMGQFIRLDPGVQLIAAMSIGQNRWMFHTHTLGDLTLHAGREPADRSVRLAMPDVVERCMRRNFYRISTAELSLPAVECWPLLDPTSVVPAEIANRALILDMLRNGSTSLAREDLDEPLVLPEVGPKFSARLVNIGGGGAGIVLDRNESVANDRARLFWLRINLMPQIPAPIAVTARIVHTHLDSAQNLYAGMAFDFGFNPSHRQFVIEQICGYVTMLQQRQAGARAKTA